MRKVAVVFGGRSCESEISVLTGVLALNVLDRERYQPFPIYIHTDGCMYTSPRMMSVDAFQEKDRGKFQRIFINGHTVYALNEKKGRIKPLLNLDVMLNCCHGGLGEGGGVSALAEWCDIPLASPDLASSAIFMDKYLTKLVMRGLDIPTVEYIRVKEADYQKRGAFLLKRIAGKLKYPVIIKPARLGSSIGVAVAHTEDEARSAIAAAFQLDGQILIERYLKGKQDVNCAAYTVNGEIVVSEPEAAFGDGVYSFEEKYLKRNSDGICGKGDNRLFSQNARGRVALKEEIRDKIRAYTRTVYKRMNLQGAVRMDYLVSEGMEYLCEVNTVPGSLAYYLFCERISDARALLRDLIEEAVRSSKASGKEIVSTGILNSVSPLKK